MKLKNTPKSVHSRAARREFSPSLDVDKSLKSLPRPEQNNGIISAFMSNRTNAGISKKRSASKAKSRAQRLRQQKGIERAGIVFDQLEIKRTKGLGRTKRLNSRKAAWEDVNNRPSNPFNEPNIHVHEQDKVNEDGEIMLSVNPETTAAVGGVAVGKPEPAIFSKPFDDEDEIT